MTPLAPSTLDPFVATKEWAERKNLQLWSALETSSTNSVAKEAASAETSALPAPALYLARSQTAGRGRGANTWITPAPGSALLSSWSYAITSVPQPILAPLVGLALFQAVQTTWPDIKLSLKAPNDLYADSQKLAGLLIETVEMGHVKRTVVGLGLNVSDKPSSVATATCLREHAILSRELWTAFLERWSTGLTVAIAAGQKTKLSSVACMEICQALNLFPGLTEPILNVDENGSLHSKSRSIPWQDL
jgi:BirA family biotin operon repressor/biotin-[acetyl-CoA-carboxylase] ligase